LDLQISLYVSSHPSADLRLGDIHHVPLAKHPQLSARTAALLAVASKMGALDVRPNMLPTFGDRPNMIQACASAIRPSQVSTYFLPTNTADPAISLKNLFGSKGFAFTIGDARPSEITVKAMSVGPGRMLARLICHLPKARSPQPSLGAFITATDRLTLVAFELPTTFGARMDFDR